MVMLLSIKNFFKKEPFLPFVVITAFIFFMVAHHWLEFGNNKLLYISSTIWVTIATMISVFAVVRHSDILALNMGEPFGTLILTLSVVSIEVVIIASVMLSGTPDPTLARNTMYSVVMIVMNGLVGITLLIGGYRFHTQFFNLMGAKSYMVVITPLTMLCLILPNFLRSSNQPIFVASQPLLLIFLSLTLYGIFLLIQTSSHSYFFTEEDQQDEHHHHDNDGNFYHTIMLIVYLVIVVSLSKKLAIPVKDITNILHAPPALSGFVVACIILSPEAAGAIKAALANKLQRAVNIYLGSVLATVALTVPSVLLIGYITGHAVILGLQPAEMVIMIITLMLSQVSFSGGKTNVLNGATHLLLFFVYLMVMFD